MNIHSQTSDIISGFKDVNDNNQATILVIIIIFLFRAERNKMDTVGLFLLVM